jgi:hypothetical protein
MSANCSKPGIKNFPFLELNNIKTGCKITVCKIKEITGKTEIKKNIKALKGFIELLFDAYFFPGFNFEFNCADFWALREIVRPALETCWSFLYTKQANIPR